MRLCIPFALRGLVNYFQRLQTLSVRNLPRQGFSLFYSLSPSLSSLTNILFYGIPILR